LVENVFPRAGNHLEKPVRRVMKEAGRCTGCSEFKDSLSRSPQG